MKLLIQNGRVLDPVSKTVTLTDLLAENGRVALLERGLETEADRIIDASGLVVSPGLVDMHVHLRDPGYTYKEDIRTGTAAAARGGVTSLACMANTDPVLDCPEQLHYVRERAKEGSGVHVYPIAAVSVGLRGEEPTDAEALKKAGAVALSDDGCNVDNANLMRDAMIRAKRQELPVLCHCEDTSMVEGRAVNEGSVSRQLWLEGRPAIAEELEVMRAAMLAEETGARVHICHISTAKAVDIVRRMKEHGVPVTCETCPQYFTLTEDEILTQGSLARINPPLRTQQDVKGIIAGLRDGTIDAIATDHAPHHIDEKNCEFAQAMNGIVGFETALGLGITYLVRPGVLTMNALLEKMSVNPANILGLNKGSLGLNKPADIIVFDPEKSYTVEVSKLLSKSKNSPYDGWELYGRPEYTIVNGEIVVNQGVLL